MKIMVLALILCVSALAETDDAKSWLSLPPADRMSYERRGSLIDSSNVFEVVVSRFDLAYSHHLFASPIAAITTDQAKIYVGEGYRCPKGKRPYIIRGLYINGGTGGFSIYHWDRNLWVFHGCLGGGGGLNKSALVVNLDFEPATVYVSASVSDL